MTKCLVTGGAGFIGSHIVEELLERGHTVRVLDNFSTGKLENIKPFEADIDIITGDIRNPGDLSKSLEGIEIVFHLAAQISVSLSMNEPEMTEEINTGGTLNLLKTACQKKIRKVLFASTAAVYGNNPELPKKEMMLPEPVSPYAISKLSGEYYCRMYSSEFAIQTVVLRYFNVFGPRQDPKSEYSGVISKFVDAITNDRRPVIYGDGYQSRDFVFVKDVIQANMLAAFSDADNMILNVGSAKKTDLRMLIDAVNKAAGKNIVPEYSRERQGDIKHSLADISLAAEKLGYKPGTDFYEGIRLTVDSVLQI